MTVYCDNEECIHCNQASKDREFWECMYAGTVSLTWINIQSEGEAGLVYCDNFQAKENKNE